MTRIQYQAENVSVFLEHVAQLRRGFRFPKDDPWGPWFRGQKIAEWDLRPKLYRDYGGYETIRAERVEDEIREEFIVRAPIMCENLPTGDDNGVEWEWYFMMQHFGTPTRLLDWTDGALIALYFAVKDNAGLYDAAVWALDPYALNKRVLREHWVIPPSVPGLESRVRNKVNRWLPKRFTRKPRLPRSAIAIYPRHTARRISTQRSCFTIHGTDQWALDKLYRRGMGCVVKIRIPAWATQSVRRELDAAGIDEATIFPDLTGVSSAIAARWKPDRHELPHRKVYTRVRPSRIHGVGVFALERIKKGTRLFEGELNEMPWFEKKMLPTTPTAVRKLYDDFAVIDESDTRYGCPETFNRLTPSWYLNEPLPGKAPNVECDRDTYTFKAARNIKPGEELTVIYDTYSRVPPAATKSRTR